VKRVAAVLLLGALAPMIQGVVGSFIPSRFCPDLSMLWVIGLGLYWHSAGGGAAISTCLGFVFDLLSGALFGQHALLRLLAFGVARVCSRQLNLRGTIPLMTFVVVFSVANAIGSSLLTAFFASGHGVDVTTLKHLIPHAIVNALFAVPVIRLVGGLSTWLDDSARQLLILQPRNGSR
jgi:cell shape-determining protein MreD